MNKSEQTISVKALKSLISESSNEFKAKLGPGVESEDKKNNGKAYEDAKKRAKDYDGGLTNDEDFARGKAKYEKQDYNRTTLDYTPENASEDYKKRVKAQVNGYTSELEEKNGLEKAADFSNNKDIYDGIKKSGQEYHKNAEDFQKTGLQAREMPKDYYKKEEMYESKDGFDMRQMIDRFKQAQEPKNPVNEQGPMKIVYFKKTTFLTEGHMLSKIPDEFKVEGKQFKMKDKTGNEYIVEWKNNNGSIIGHSNKKGMVESINRMKEMFDYKSIDSNTTSSYRLNEGEDVVRDMVKKARNNKIIK